MEVSGPLNALASLRLGKRHWYALKWRLGGPHTWCRRLAEKKNFFLLLRIEIVFLVCPEHSVPCHILAALSRVMSKFLEFYIHQYLARLILDIRKANT
jgi:hypothetical protein